MDLRRCYLATGRQVVSEDVRVCDGTGCICHLACRRGEVSHPFGLIVHTWVERITQAIAEKRERQHGKRNGDRREDGHVPVRAKVLLIFADHLAPAWHWRVDPDADEAQGSLGEDDLRDP